MTLTDHDQLPAGAARRRVWLFALGLCVLMVLVAVASNAEQFAEPGSPQGQRSVLPIEAALGEETEGTRRVSEPIRLPESVAIALAVAAGLGVLYLLSRQRFSFRFSRPSVQFSKTTAVVSEEEEADAIATAAEDLIGTLRAGGSPRVAIQRAYAAVESGFGAPELARRPAETPLRYLTRIFGRHAAVKEPLERLTALFQRARFSEDPVDESMRDHAVQALADIRDYYQAFAWKKIADLYDRAAKR